MYKSSDILNYFAVFAFCCEMYYLQSGLLLGTGNSMSGLLSALTISFHWIVSTLHRLLRENFTPPFRISAKDNFNVNSIELHK